MGRARATRSDRRSAAQCSRGRTCCTQGPVPAVPRRELLRLRAAFLARAGRGSRRAILASLELRDAQLLRAFGEGIDVVLWFEHDLYDQLQLLDVLALAHEAGVEPELVVVGSSLGKPSFRGLGELAGDELATLWPDRRRADTQSLATAASGEQALGGEADRVELLGIDRWVGGTHVTPASLWRWYASERVFA